MPKKKVLVDGREIEIDIDDPSLIDEIVKLQKSNEDLKSFIEERMPKTIVPVDIPKVTQSKQKSLIDKFFEWLKTEENNE